MKAFIFIPTKQESSLKEIINLGNKKVELLKTFLLAVSRMYLISAVLFKQISGMRKFC